MTWGYFDATNLAGDGVLGAGSQRVLFLSPNEVDVKTCHIAPHVSHSQ